MDESEHRHNMICIVALDSCGLVSVGLPAHPLVIRPVRPLALRTAVP